MRNGILLLLTTALLGCFSPAGSSQAGISPERVLLTWQMEQPAPDNLRPFFDYIAERADSSDYTNHSHLTRDTDLNTLHEDERWAEVTAKVLANKEKMEDNYDKPLAAMLDTIYQEDQQYRPEYRYTYKGQRSAANIFAKMLLFS